MSRRYGRHNSKASNIIFWEPVNSRTMPRPPCPPFPRCPCGAGDKSYTDCCGRYLDAGKTAPTAEALMRSRYVAYTLGREGYLLETWHPSTRPASRDVVSELHNKWLGLEVKRHEQRGPSNAVVEFVARYKIG